MINQLFQKMNNMKRYLLVCSFLLALGLNAIAQSSGDNACYTKYAKKFEERGCEEIVDGTYPDVIITVRSGSNEECYVGKCDVKDGKIIAMYMKLQDGKYELFKKKPRYEQVITITNGMSKTFITVDEELINVLFVKKMKPKKAEFIKAPDPDAE